MAIQNRYEFMYYVACTNANPNGDPDMGNTPRIDPQTMRGYITDVATKRRIRNYVDYGINILGISAISLDTEHLPAYFPENYQRPQSIKKLIGEYKGNETEYLVHMIQQIEKQPLMLHLIEFTRELYRDTVNDDLLQEALEEKKLTKYASRLMQVLHELTLLDEGYMPIEPLDDRGTQKIRESITNHLKI